MSMKEVEEQRYGKLLQNTASKIDEEKNRKSAEFEHLVDSKVQTAVERYSKDGTKPEQRKKTYGEIWQKINELEKEISNLKLEMYKTMDSVH